jgi:hypothetical protein
LDGFSEHLKGTLQERAAQKLAQNFGIAVDFTSCILGTEMAKSGTSIGNAWSVRKSSGALSITWLNPAGVISAVVSVVAAHGDSSTYCWPTVSLKDS